MKLLSGLTLSPILKQLKESKERVANLPHVARWKYSQGQGSSDALGGAKYQTKVEKKNQTIVIDMSTNRGNFLPFF